MSTPGDRENERILWSGSISHWFFAGRWCLILLLLALLVASFVPAFLAQVMFLTGMPPGALDGGLWIGRGVLAAAALGIFLWIAIARAQRHYRVTSKRVSVEYGIISRTSNEIRIDHIRSINLSKTGLTGVLGIGRLEFSSAATDDAEVVFWHVAGAGKIRDLVRSVENVEEAS